MIPLHLSLSTSVLCGSEELSWVQAETERSKLQVLLNQQQVTGQPPQCLHHQQGTTLTHTHTHTHTQTQTRINIPYTTLMHMYNAPHLTFCLPYLAGSRQTPAGCRHQSSSSCGFQRCGKHVFVCGYKYKKKTSVYLFLLNKSVCYFDAGWQ